MIFPLNVQKVTSEASKVAGSEKTKLIILCSIIANVALAMFTVPLFASVNIPWWFPIGLQSLLFLLIGIFVIRVFWIKEDEKLLEYEGQVSDSASRFFLLRSATPHDFVAIAGKKSQVPLFEFDNGTNTFVLRLRFGANDDIKAAHTRKVMEEIFKLIGSYNLEHRNITAPEKFSESPEARRQLELLEGIEDKLVSVTLIDIMQTVLDYSDDASTVNIHYLQVRTKFNHQRFDLDVVVGGIVRLLTERKTSFRSFDFLDSQEYIEFIREFYGLEIVDISTIRSRSTVDMDNSYKDSVQIYKIVGANGKVRKSTKDSVEEATSYATKVGGG